MTTDTEMNSYATALRDAEKELAGMDERRRDLMATIAVLKRLEGDEQQRLSLGSAVVSDNDDNAKDVGVPEIPTGFFRGKTPTLAYRDLMKLWPRNYKPPQIVDAFIAGGMETKTRTALLGQVHSVLKRERERAKKQGA